MDSLDVLDVRHRKSTSYPNFSFDEPLSYLAKLGNIHQIMHKRVDKSRSDATIGSAFLCIELIMTIDQFLDDFSSIDMDRPWMAPYQCIHDAFSNDKQIKSTDALATWLNQYFTDTQIAIRHHASDTPLTFTSQNDLPHGVAYEAYIGATAKIPTRDNLHDWFGACVWSVFPKTKALLNHHHIRQITQQHKDKQASAQDCHSSRNPRGRVRDALTVFDENGAIIVTSRRDIKDALQRFDWQNALVAPHKSWHNQAAMGKYEAQCYLFGHALLEQLITPRKPLCAHSVILMVDDAFFNLDEAAKLLYIDEQLATYVDSWLSGALVGYPIDQVSPRQLQPLPVLGVPHFWAGQDADFYADTQVFRPGRKHQ